MGDIASAGIQPLPVPLKPIADESLPGLIARATAANVLVQTQIICQEVGFRSIDYDLGHADRRHMAERLADKIGCSAEDVAMHSHQALDASPQAVKPGNVVRIGGSACRRDQLHFNTRRISPASLAISPHHRLVWLHNQLPFCPESLELLIDKCTSCGEVLRWSRCRGIGTCEYCRHVIGSENAAFLDPKLANAYRGFASIVAGMPSERDRIVSGLAPTLARLSPISLSTIMFSLGALVRLDHDVSERSELTHKKVAECAAVGFELIQNWPDTARAAIQSKIASAPGKGDGLAAFMVKARKLAVAHRVRPDQAQLVQDAFPELFRRVAYAFEAGDKSMNVSELIKRTNLRSSKIELIRKAKALPRKVFREGPRVGMVLDRAKALEFVQRNEDARPASRLERALDLPRYGLEQLVCLGLVTAEAHPALKVIYPDLLITSQSMSNFIVRLKAKRSEKPMPRGTVTIYKATRAIGGELKPWGYIYQAMLQGEIEFWIDEEKTDLAGSGRPLNRSIKVMTSQILQFREVQFGRNLFPEFPFATKVSQRDALEILNLNSKYIQPVIEAGRLQYEMQNATQVFDLDAVLVYAREMIPVGELSHYLGVLEHLVPKKMATSFPDVKVVDTGWERPAMEDRLGLV